MSEIDFYTTTMLNRIHNRWPNLHDHNMSTKLAITKNQQPADDTV